MSTRQRRRYLFIDGNISRRATQADAYAHHFD